jgi:hypothetical protein
MARHVLKCDPKPFQDIWDDLKRCEIRREVDHWFDRGDTLILRELTSRGSDMVTGREVELFVTHVQRGYGLPPSTCVMSVALQKKYQIDRLAKA